jgi:hypothetical protein
LLSITTQHASSWVSNAMQGGAQLMLSAQWRSAVRHRYVLPAASFMYVKRCRCGTYVEDEPNHFHMCKYLAKTAMYERHQLIVAVLTRWLRGMGAVVVHEPTLTDGTQPDMLVHMVSSNVSYYVEVSVTCATGASNMSKYHTATKQLAAAEGRAQSKTSKYAKVLADMGSVYTFVPFVLESHGGMNKAAMHWLQQVSQQHELPGEKLGEILRQVSSTLQRGNAIVDHKGLTNMRIYGEVRDSDRVARELQQYAHGSWQVSQLSQAAAA